MDVENQREEIRVPQHNDGAAMEMTNDFKEVRSKFMLQKAGMIHGLTEVSTSPKVFSFAGSPEILNEQMYSIKN